MRISNTFCVQSWCFSVDLLIEYSKLKRLQQGVSYELFNWVKFIQKWISVTAEIWEKFLINFLFIISMTPLVPLLVLRQGELVKSEWSLSCSPWMFSDFLMAMYHIKASGSTLHSQLRSVVNRMMSFSFCHKIIRKDRFSVSIIPCF